MPGTGLAGQSAAKPARIATHGYHVMVRADEVLSTGDAVEIMTAFLASCDLPAAYRWRSKREEVEEAIRETQARQRRH